MHLYSTGQTRNLNRISMVERNMPQTSSSSNRLLSHHVPKTQLFWRFLSISVTHYLSRYKLEMEAWDPNYIFFDPECERTSWPHGPIALRVLRYLGFIIGYPLRASSE